MKNIKLREEKIVSFLFFVLKNKKNFCILTIDVDKEWICVYTGVFFLIEAIFYSVLLMCVYFSKKVFKIRENKVYSILVVISFFELLIELILDFVGPMYKIIPQVSYFFAKFYCFCIELWLTFFVSYILFVSLNMKKKEKYISIVKSVLTIAMIVFSTLNFVLPLEFLYDGNIAYIYGPSVNIIYISAFLYSFVGIIALMWNLKNIKDKRFFPILLFLILGGVASFIQYNNPGLLLAVPIHAFITFLMYFTIENPDLKIIEELTKTQAMTEASNAEKNKFIFSITNDIQDKIDKLDKLYLEMSNCNSLEIINEDLVKSKNIIDTARNKIRNTIDVSSLDVRNLNEVKNKYNPKLLFNSIYYNYKNKLDKNIDFRIIMEDNIPNELYGDSIRVKQIVSTLLGNAFKYTKDGYVEFRINSIIKSNICRLIIVVEDSGCGIDVFKQKEIMSNHEDMTNAEIINKDNLELNLKLVRKIINIIGGTFIIESGSTKGAKITVTLNQEIVTSNNDTIENKYKDYYNDIKNIGVISSNEKNVRVVKSIGKKNGDVVESFDMTKTCLDKIRNGESFNIIVIDEDMDKIDARSFLDKVRQVDGFKGKVFVITKNKSINLKKELKEYGFDAVLINPLNKKDIEDNFK